MISRKYKCIFIHIPKTAGTSIENILRDRECPVAAGSTHFKMLYYKNKFPKEYKSYLKFSIVRNPWERLVSGFSYFQRGGNGSPQDKQKKKLFGDDFKYFTRNIDTFDELEDTHFIQPQYEYLYIDGDLKVDHLIRFERMDEDYRLLRKRLGLQIKDLYKIRATKHKHYTDLYDEETRQTVAEKYAKDIEYFGYEFEG